MVDNIWNPDNDVSRKGSWIQKETQKNNKNDDKMKMFQTPKVCLKTK